MTSTSFAGRHPVATTLLALLFVLLAGGVVAYFATDRGRKLLPALENASLTTANITTDSLKTNMKITLRNRVPLTVRIDSFSYLTRLDGAALARGTKNRPTVVRGRATNDITMPFDVDLSELKKQLETAQQDCVDVRMTMILYAKLPLVGAQRLPVSVSKKVYIPKLPKVELADVDVTDLGLKNGEAVVRFKVTNYNPFPVTIKQVNYRFRVGGDDMDIRGIETKDVTFRQRGTQIMPVHIRFQPKALPKVAFKTLFKARKTAYNLTSTVTVAAGKFNPKDVKMNFASAGTLQDLKEIPK